LNPQLAEDSTYRAPFFNRYTEFVLSTTIALDHVVASIERSVRARRGARPLTASAAQSRSGAAQVGVARSGRDQQ